MEIGYFFGIKTLGAFLAGVLIQYHPKHIDLRFWIFLSCFNSSISYFLVGPSKLLCFPDSVYPIMIGNFIAGYFAVY